METEIEDMTGFEVIRKYHRMHPEEKPEDITIESMMRKNLQLQKDLENARVVERD